jgi:hypothetical protein
MEAKVNIKPDQRIKAGLLILAAGAAVSLGGCSGIPSLSPEASNKPTTPQIRKLRLPPGEPPTAIITPPPGSTLAVVAATQDGSGNYKSATLKQCTIFHIMCSKLTVTPESQVDTNGTTTSVSWLLYNTNLTNIK